MKLVTILAAVSLYASPLLAQSALVLSGGGSRGLAHIGVLEVLEERGYDSDLVVGTSMGAVIGALYAAGYAPEAIRKQVLEIGWRGMFEPTPIVVGHERTVRYPMLSFDVSADRYRVSRGLVGQWRINRALAALLFEANARSRGDFDKLPRRFRPVVADLKTGEAIALERGDLALAARASMSVPGFFSPVEWDGRVLVDGGIAANLPTGFARRLGATNLIAVDVARAPPEIHSLAPFAVVQRALDHMQHNTQRDTVKPNAMVAPQIPAGFSGANFPDDPSFLVELGRAAAERDLPPMIVRSQPANRTTLLLPDSFSALLVEAPDSSLAGLARAVFRAVAPGQYDAAAVASAVDKLYATGLVEAVWPRVDDHDALIVRVVGQPRIAVSAAAHFENDRGGRAWGVIQQYATIANRPAVLSAAAQLETLARSASLGARIHSSRGAGLGWSVGSFVDEESVRFFEEDEILTQDVVRAGGWLGVELPHILRKRVATGSVRAEWIDVEDGTDGLAWGPVLRWASVEPPASVIGVPFTLEAERRWGDFTYSRLALAGSIGTTVGPLHVAALADFRAVNRGAPLDAQPSLGEGHMIPGLQWGERRGLVRAAAGIDAAHPFFSGFVRLRVRSGAVSSDVELIDDARWITGGQIGVFFPTPLGALDVTYGLASRGGGRFDVSIGQRF